MKGKTKELIRKAKFGIGIYTSKQILALDATKLEQAREARKELKTRATIGRDEAAVNFVKNNPGMF